MNTTFVPSLFYAAGVNVAMAGPMLRIAILGWLNHPFIDVVPRDGALEWVWSRL
jgi:hypothetical protein